MRAESIMTSLGDAAWHRVSFADADSTDQEMVISAHADAHR